MEGLFLLLILLFILLPVAVVALFVKNAGLSDRVAYLEQRLDRLQASAALPEAFAPAPVPAGDEAPTPGPREEPATAWVPPREREAAAAATTDMPEMVADPARLAEAEAALADAEPEAVRPEQPRETLGGLFERLVAGKLLIWLGGIALVLAAIFLIRYSIEVGLITPAARMAGAGLFGLALVGAGEYARRGRFADDPRIAQALVGAGIAVLYATIYGTHSLYALIDSRAAFLGMAAVTAAALGLSLRHGAPTAIMGLVGGFLTPLLVGSQNQSAAPLLAYLALLDLALFALAWKRGWTWLAAAATLLSFFWTFYVVADRSAADALLGGIFIAALALGASLVRPGTGRHLALVQPLGLGLLQLAILVVRTDVGAPAWGLFGALSLAAILLAVLRREHWPAPPAALVFALLLLAVKAGVGPDDLVPAAAIGIGLLFGGAGLLLASRAPALMWTLLSVGGLAGPWLILRNLRPDYLTQAQWGGLAALLALGPVLLVWLHRRRAGREAPADLVLLAAGAGAALLAGAAIWDLAAPDWIAAGWLGVALALALAARRLGDLALGTVAIVAVLIGVARALWTVPELAMALPNGITGLPILAADLPGAMTALAALGVPALLLTAMRLALPPLPMRARRLLPILAGILGTAALYLWFKQAFGLADSWDFLQRGLLERTIVTQALFVAGWLLGSGLVRPPRLAAEDARFAGTLLTAFAAARLVWFDMVMFNPVLVDQYVGTLPVLNLILPAYLLSAVWLYLARRRAGNRPDTWPWFAGFLLALTIGVALMVRQGFQGGHLATGEVGNAEAYGYSLAFLLLSIAVIVAGVRLADKALRVAGLILLTATIVKVFLVDAAALTGVLRILSFLVLGIALIGMGRLYGPILRAEREEE
ncbi:MAG TPA: DUF2339 domain-containing protein [Allosphingosinicella sp.]|nr:DUF2339 domain-containing protein [Allosphingosinicella sp.]